MSKRMILNIKNEVSVLRLIDSPHVIKVHEIIKTLRHYYLVVEYCNGCDLESLTRAGLKLKEKDVSFIFK